MDVNKLVFLSLAFCFSLAAGNYGFAQNSQKKNNGAGELFFLEGKISLDSLTKYIHNRSGIRISFNSVKVKGSKELEFPKADYSLSKILDRIKKTTSLSYTFYNGYIIFTDKPVRRFPKQAVDKPASTHPAHKKLSNSETTISQNVNAHGRSNATPQKSLHRPDSLKGKTDFEKSTILNKPKDDAVKSSNPKRDQSLNKNNIGDSITTSSAKANNERSGIKKDSIFYDSSVNMTRTKTKSNIDSAKTFTATSPGKSAKLKNNNGSSFHFGLQWDEDIPLYGVQEYFTGTNAHNQFYNLFIPGLWAGRQIGNNGELQLLIRPVEQYFTGNKSLGDSIGPLSVFDSSLVRRSTAIIKTSGFFAGLIYDYNITERWAIGTGLHFYWQSAALVNQQTTRLTGGASIPDSLFGVKRSAAEWKYVKTFFITGKVEILYRLNKLSLGAAVFIPVTKVLELPSGGSPVNATVFIRWKIK
ncbi:MAG: hypothetical protein JST75_16955 [Bacteroidetes bacterium]|nr:hypothetical protein [Bacteroidota bacterium]